MQNNKNLKKIIFDAFIIIITKVSIWEIKNLSPINVVSPRIILKKKKRVEQACQIREWQARRLQRASFARFYHWFALLCLYRKEKN